MHTMRPSRRPSRTFFPLLLALTLLFAQQAGGMHALSHTLAQQKPATQKQDQQDKQSAHYPACAQCAAYTELGSALNGTADLLLVIAAIAATCSLIIFILRPTQPLAVVARGPPYSA